MKNNVLRKVGISIFVCLVAALYLSVFNFLYGYSFVFASFFTNWWLIASLFVLVFIFPYIKIDSQSLLKRGLFFGLAAWLINLPRVLIELKSTFITLNWLRFLLAIGGPVFFIILGLIIAFCYKRFLPSEFRLSLQKSKLSFAKTIITIVVVSAIYFLFMFFSQFWVLKRLAFRNISIFRYATLLGLFSFVRYLILGSVFTILYNQTIGRIKMWNIKKWFLFSAFIFFFSDPLIIRVKDIGIYQFWEQFSKTSPALAIPHFLSVLVIGYVLVRFSDAVSGYQDK